MSNDHRANSLANSLSHHLTNANPRSPGNFCTISYLLKTPLDVLELYPSLALGRILVIPSFQSYSLVS